jgi:hypothetical protein
MASSFEKWRRLSGSRHKSLYFARAGRQQQPPPQAVFVLRRRDPGTSKGEEEDDDEDERACEAKPGARGCGDSRLESATILRRAGAFCLRPAGFCILASR